MHRISASCYLSGSGSSRTFIVLRTEPADFAVHRPGKHTHKVVASTKQISLHHFRLQVSLLQSFPTNSSFNLIKTSLLWAIAIHALLCESLLKRENFTTHHSVPFVWSPLIGFHPEGYRPDNALDLPSTHLASYPSRLHIVIVTLYC